MSPPHPVVQPERLDHRDRAVAKSIHALRRLAHAEEAALLRLGDAATPQPSVDEIQEGSRVCVGVRRGHRLLGCVSLEQDDEPGQISVAWLVVHPAHQRRGVGRALLVHALAQAPTAVFSVVVAAGNLPALALYRQLGFVEYRRGTLGTDALAVIKLRTQSDPPSVPLAAGVPACAAPCPP